MTNPVRAVPARGAVARAAAGALLAAALLAGPPAAGATETEDGAPRAQGRSAAAGPERGAVRVEAVGSADAVLAAAAQIALMDTREKAASVVMAHTPGTDPATLRAFMAATGIGGFIIMGANVPPDAEAMRALTRALIVDPARPPLVGIDQEGGDVRRLRDDGFPSSVTLKNEEPAATTTAFAGRGALVSRVGIDVNFGIVADFTGDDGSFIHRRSLGTDAPAAAERVAAAVDGEAPFVFSTLKHFPGHGAAPGDSHRVIPATGMSLDDWRAGEALPFAAGIEAGAEFVMFGHLAYTAVDPAPASLSREWHRILRVELDFTGVAITDDMAMLEASGIASFRDPVQNAVVALAAGNDMILGVSYTTVERVNGVIDGIASAVSSGALPAERLDEAATRVLALRLRSAANGSVALPCDACTPAG